MSAAPYYDGPSWSEYIPGYEAREKAAELAEEQAARAWQTRTGERIAMGLHVSEKERAIWRANLEAEASYRAPSCPCGGSWDARGHCAHDPRHVTRDALWATGLPF